MNAAGYGAVLLASLLTSLVAAPGPAAACSCLAIPDNVRAAGTDQVKAWMLEHATDVVRGRITDVRAGDDVTRNGNRVVVAKIKVSSVVKGDLPVGEKTILTRFGTGDCGIASALLVSIARQRDIILEVQKNADFPGELFVDMCGYGEITPAR